jgi:hypothetical protein
MTIEDILKGMYHTIDIDRTITTNYGNQSYDFVNRVNNSVQVSQDGNLVTFTFKVNYENYEKWIKGGSYRSPYRNYTNSGSVSFTKEELQSYPSGFNHLINLYNRLKRSVSSGSEWREIMRYFWKDWDFPDTAEKKQLQQDAACLKAIIDKDTPISIANAYLAASSLLDKLYPK